MESEAYAASSAACDAEWLCSLLAELGVVKRDHQIVMHMDSQAAIARLSTPGLGKVRHAAIRLAYLKDLVSSGRMCIHYTGTQELVSDLLTKHVKGTVLRHLRPSLSLANS